MLQDAFNDLHKESIKLGKLVSSNKKVISNLEKEISKLNKELEELKLENETLGLIDANLSCTKCLMYWNAIKSYSCSSRNKFEKEINDLKNTLSKFTFGKNNWDIILGKQRCVFDKAGLGYNPKSQ